MKPHLRYAWYVARHKWFVFVAGRRVGVPLWRLIIHDWTKLSRVEWGPYVRRFYAGRTGQTGKALDPEEFHVGWTHHWHRNPHHWEHWLVFKDDGTMRPLEMPSTYVREMVADWMGANRAITGRWGVRDWYPQNRERFSLGPQTRLLAESLLELYA